MVKIPSPHPNTRPRRSPSKTVSERNGSSTVLLNNKVHECFTASLYLWSQLELEDRLKPLLVGLVQLVQLVQPVLDLVGQGQTDPEAPGQSLVFSQHSSYQTLCSNSVHIAEDYNISSTGIAVTASRSIWISFSPQVLTTMTGSATEFRLFPLFHCTKLSCKLLYVRGFCYDWLELLL